MFGQTDGDFGVIDYVVFLVLCLGSCSGGLYYSATASKSSKTVKDIKDYLLGGKHLSTFPVAMSLIASYVSGVTILGTPAEIYNYGSQYWMVLIGVCCSCVMVAVLYLPVFCTLRLSSSYEYLELRFNRHVRAVASMLFLIDEILFLPVVVYIPALAFNQLTGFSVYGVGALMVFICGLYTALGGLRAVVWTDMVQTVIMFVAVFAVAVAGTITMGGFGNIASIAHQSHRLQFDNWSFDPHERQTGWTAIIGGFIYWTCFNSVNQTMVQRYMSLPTMKMTVVALLIFCLGAVFAISMCVWLGLTAWATWVSSGCSPGGAPIMGDRMLPAFVVYVSKVAKLPGLSGIFLAGVFGAGLSSLSCVLNACALVVVEDILRGWLRLRMRPFREGMLARAVSAVLAVISVAMLLVIEKLGGVLGVATALSSIAASATCGIFTLGMVCWWVGPRGATAGGIAGAIAAGTISFGVQLVSGLGYRWPPLGMSDQCAKNSSFVSTDTLVDPDQFFTLFRISYNWIAPIGLLVTLSVGAVVGYFFDRRDNIAMDIELFHPKVHRFLPDRAFEYAGAYRRRLDLRHSGLVPPKAKLLLEKNIVVDPRLSSDAMDQGTSAATTEADTEAEKANQQKK